MITVNVMPRIQLTSRVTETTIGRLRTNSPLEPGIVSIGRKAATVVSVAMRTGNAIWPAPSAAARNRE